jgi:hypothetical protein
VSDRVSSNKHHQRIPRLPSDDELSVPEEVPQEEGTVPEVSDVIQDRRRRLQEVRFQTTMEETNEGFEALIRDFAQGVVHQGLDDL